MENPALHVDWLTVSQQHVDAPEWGSSLLVDYDFKTREIIKQVIKSEQLQGSWESSLLVRCVGGRVEVSGNPSKWGRLESVANGCRSVFAALDVYNAILADLELPAFSCPDRLIVMGEGGARDRTMDHGARISRVDIAGCLVLGAEASVRPYIDWLEMQRIGKRGQPYDRKGPLSLLAGTRRRRQSAVYGKALEVIEQSKRWARRHLVDAEAAASYLVRLSDRLSVGGWCRREARLGTDYLSSAGLQYVSEWDEAIMLREWLSYGVTGEVEEVGAVIDWREEAMTRLQAMGLGERAARQRMETLLAWMAGADCSPGPGRSRATFFRIAADLRKAVGVDIRSVPNVVSLGSRAQQLARPVQARYATRADVVQLYSGLSVPVDSGAGRVNVVELNPRRVRDPLSEVA